MQKVRIKDKNQSNISFAEDDYEVAMGLVSDDDTQSDTESYNDLDETFIPNWVPAPPIRGRSIRLRSDRTTVQTTINYTTRSSLLSELQRREDDSQQRQTRASRRQQLQQESYQQQLQETNESSESSQSSLNSSISTSHSQSQTSGCSVKSSLCSLEESNSSIIDDTDNKRFEFSPILVSSGR